MLKKPRKLLLCAAMLMIMLIISGCSIKSDDIALSNISIGSDMKASATVTISNIDKQNFLSAESCTLNQIIIYYAYSPDKLTALKADTDSVGKDPYSLVKDPLLPESEYDGVYSYDVPEKDVTDFKTGEAASYSKNLKFDLPVAAKGKNIAFLVVLDGTDFDAYTTDPPSAFNGTATSQLFEVVSHAVTFNVANGSWNDGTAEAKEVILTGAEGEELKLNPDDIPAVGSKPNSGHKAGNWDVTPGTDTAITEDMTYTYTYAKDDTPTPPPAATAKAVVAVKGIAKGKTMLKFSWNKVSSAATYEVYLAKSGKNAKMKRVKTLKASKTGWTKKGLKKNTAYRFYVIAKDTKGKVIAKSLKGHALTSNVKGKYTNAKSLALKKSKVSLKTGSTFKIKATMKGTVKGKKLLNHCALLRYTSDSPAVANVSAKGVIKAVAPGTCKVYVQTANGIWKTVTVTVK